MKPDLHGLTHVGNRRKSNEDAFLIARLDKTAEVLQTSLDETSGLARLSTDEAYLLVVADGVASTGAGSMASNVALEVLAEEIQSVAGCYYTMDADSEDDLIESLEEAVDAAHATVVARRGEDGKAATTVTMAVLIGPRAYVVHVGDSRGYVLHEGELRQFTRDQTMLEALLDSGAVSEEDAARSPFGNVLTNAVGSSEPTPSLGIVDFEPGDVLLLCSDGLTKHVDEEALAEVLGQDLPAQSMCEVLLAGALTAGGTDNITVIVARMGAATGG